MDASALLLVLTRIAEALETANIIAMASYPDVSTSSRSSSPPPAPSAGCVPEVQVSDAGGVQVFPSPFASISEGGADHSIGEGEREMLPGCGRKVGEQEKKESGVGCIECQLSGRAACLCYFLGRSIPQPTALSPRPRLRSLSPHPPSSILSHTHSHSGASVAPSVSFRGSEDVWIHSDGMASSSTAASKALAFSFEGDPLENSEDLAV